MEQRVAVVTGGGRGIGRAVCVRLAADGAQVMAAARSADELAETQRIIESAGGRCRVHPTDVSDGDQIDALIRETIDRFDRLDVLVNCAGTALLGSVEEMDPERFDVLLSVNVSAVYRTCRAAWPALKRGGGGVIVNISSMASVDPFPGFSAYGASKAWVNGWTRGLADEGRSCNVRVFAVAPGAVDTQMLRGAFPDFPGDKALAPEDVAGVVFTLTRPECRYATGQTIFMKK